MTQNSFNPREHLVKIRSKDGTMKDYLPANWRLYQARLEHPDIVLESEIIHLDPEHNFVIVKALVFVGTDYASATLKCSAMKQGLLSALDKVETAAKARALRDLGISTELALDHDDSDTEDTPVIASERSTARQQNGTSHNTTQPTEGPPAPVQSDAVELKAIMQELKALGLVSTKADWQEWRRTQLGVDIPVNALTHDHITLLRHALEDHKMAGVPSTPAA